MYEKKGRRKGRKTKREREVDIQETEERRDKKNLEDREERSGGEKGRIM